MRILLGLGVLGALARDLPAQIGDKSDKPGVVQKPLVPRELIPPAPVRTAAEELKTFQLAPGFRAELAAGDPLVQDPVAMAIDPQGRMWVVEMRSYMPDLDGNGENHPTGRVSVLEDTNGDGKWERGVTTFRGQWGLSQDDFGRLYHGSNSDQLRCDVVPSHYLGRNPNYPRPPART